MADFESTVRAFALLNYGDHSQNRVEKHNLVMENGGLAKDWTKRTKRGKIARLSRRKNRGK